MTMIEITRQWCMPNKETFTMKPIKEFLKTNICLQKCEGGTSQARWIDPFVRNSIFKDRMIATNDLNPEIDADFHLEALEFLKSYPDGFLDGVLFDPPYSPRQIKECYDGIGRKVTQQDTQAKFWGDCKKEIARVLRKGGKCISFGWNSGGIGKCNGFEIKKILICPHGGNHNDTIVTLDIKK